MNDENHTLLDPATLAGVRVLIADDEVLMRDLLKSVLTRLGVTQFETAEDGEEALRKYVLAGHDMLFLDIDMPRKTGLECLKELRDIDPKVFVVMVSGHSSIENVRAASALGVGGFLVKPYSSQKVREVAQNFLARKKPA